MTPNELKQLILVDAAAAALFAAKDDHGCALRCTAIAPQVRVSVSNADVMKHAIINGYWPKITIAGEVANQNEQVRGLAISVGAWVENIDSTTDFTLPAVQSMLAGLVASGLMTQAQATDLQLLSYTPQVITQQEVEFARTRI